MMVELRQFTGGKPTKDKIEGAVDAIYDALWEHLAGEPLATVIGALEIAKLEIIRGNGDDQ